MFKSFENTLKKISVTNFQDKLLYWNFGIDGTAIDILRLVIRNKSKENDSKFTETNGITNMRTLVKQLSMALAETINIENYQNLPTNVKNQIKNLIAEKLFEVSKTKKCCFEIAFRDFKFPIKEHVSTATGLTNSYELSGLKLIKVYEENAIKDAETKNAQYLLGVTNKESDKNAYAINFPKDFQDREWLKQQIKAAIPNYCQTSALIEEKESIELNFIFDHSK